MADRAVRKQDLLDTLDAWHALTKAIDEKSSESRSEPFVGNGLFSKKVLQAANIRNKGFAWKFFTHVWKPCSDISFLGLGLRLPTDKELISNVWSNADDTAASILLQDWIGDIVNWPIPILMGSRQAKNWLHYPSVVPDEKTWALYIEKCGVYWPWFVEDGCRLALPYSVGANGCL